METCDEDQVNIHKIGVIIRKSVKGNRAHSQWEQLRVACYLSLQNHDQMAGGGICGLKGTLISGSKWRK